MPRTLVSLALVALFCGTGLSQIILTDSLPNGRRVRPGFSAAYVEEHHISVTITDGIAETKIRQVFRNPNHRPLEGRYLFALPENAAISNFAMSMGGKMVQGEVLEKDKAARIYQQIVSRRNDPGLLEYMGRRAFRARIFPIPARGTTTIELSFAETLESRDRLVEYRYPFKTDPFCRHALNRASVDLRIASKEPLRAVYSPSHEVQVVKKGDHQARVSWEANRFRATKDFTLLYSTSRDRVGATLFAHDENAQGEGAFLLLLAPSEESGRVVEKDVVFVVDTSGSMAGAKMEQTRRSLKYCVNSLREGDRFEIINFATEPTPLFDALKPADAEHRKQALNHVAQLNAAGGTNINDALLQALKLTRSKDRPFLVIFMTDGEPTIGVTATNSIRANVKKANEALTRLFVFGIGDEVRTELLDLLAEDNHGARDYVGNQEDIEVKISSFFRKVSSPVLSKVEVAFEGVTTSDVYPRPLPDLFRGSQLLLTGRYKGASDAKVVLRGQIQGKAFEQRFPVKFESRKSTAFIPRLWAVRKVGYLMDQIRLNGQKQELKDEVVRLGKRYGIVTPYTSYLVLEDAPIARGDRRPPPPGGGRPGNGTWGGGRRRGGRSRDRDQGRENKGTRAVDELIAQAPRTKGKPSGATPGQGGGAVGGANRGVPAPGLRTKPQDRALEEAEKARKEEGKKLRESFSGSTVTLSKSLNRLRHSTRSGDTGVLVKRVGNRTFYLRQDHYVEAEILDVSAEQLKAQLITIHAYGKEYFELLAKSPELGSVLALGDRILFRHGKSIIRILPAPPAPAKKNGKDG